MNAVSFDFLNEVSEVSISNGAIYFKLHRTLNSSSPAYVEAYIEPRVTQISVEDNHTLDPQSAFDRDIDCFYIDTETVALVDDFDNVHAIQDMPFKLTGEQVNTINSYLEDIAKEEMVV